MKALVWSLLLVFALAPAQSSLIPKGPVVWDGADGHYHARTAKKRPPTATRRCCMTRFVAADRLPDLQTTTTERGRRL